ncbi:C1QL2-like protein, partial [Mya arenaria]
SCKFDPIAFSYRQPDYTFSTAQVVPYSTRVTNHNHASFTGGIFTCTKSGIYKFQIYGNSYTSARIFLEIYRGSSLLATLYGHANGDFATAGNVVILNLHSHDTIKVTTRGTYPVRLSNTNLNTFTGVEMGSLFLEPEFGYRIFPAFSATADHHQNIAGGDVVQYHNELVDSFKAFNMSDGVFYSPSGGYYIFHFFSVSQQHAELWLDLYQNNQYQGDSVSVKSHAQKPNHLYGTQDHIYTTFSGAQLISDEDLGDPDSYPVVVFSVGLTYNLTLPNGATLVYTKVFVDHTNNYDPGSGHYRILISGVYEFNFHCLAETGRAVNLRLVKTGGSLLSEIYSHRVNHRSMAGNAVVVELTGGEEVYVVVYKETNFLVGGSREVYCTFSGHLLYAAQPDEIVG